MRQGPVFSGTGFFIVRTESQSLYWKTPKNHDLIFVGKTCLEKNEYKWKICNQVFAFDCKYQIIIFDGKFSGQSLKVYIDKIKSWAEKTGYELAFRKRLKLTESRSLMHVFMVSCICPCQILENIIIIWNNTVKDLLLINIK